MGPGLANPLELTLGISASLREGGSGTARTFNGVRYSTLNRWLGFLGGTGWVLGCERVFGGLIGVKNCRNGAKKLLRVVRLTIIIEGLVIRILVKGYQS